MNFEDNLKKFANVYGISLSESQIQLFGKYEQLLIEWNRKINLTAITESDQIAIKHMIDSLSCYDPKVFPIGAKVIDVGTGAGFPGLPLRIWRNELDLTLLDSLQKRINFLDCVVKSLNLHEVKLVHGRAEDFAQKVAYREFYDVVTSRAVARLNVLCELCIPFARIGGYFVALKGAQYISEIEEAETAITVLGGQIEKILPIKLPGIEDIRAVIYIKKIKQTPSTYPRKAGTPEKNPLIISNR